MKKIAKFTALSLTAGMLLAACGDTDDTEEDMPGTEEPADEGMDNGLEDDGMDDGLEDDGMDDNGMDDNGLEDDDMDDDVDE